MTLQALAQQTLFLFGLGFLGANLKIGIDLLRYRRLRREPLLVWPRPRQPFHRLAMLLGVVQALLLASFLLLHRPPAQLFALGMMLIYFLGATPLSGTINRGFYQEGIWSDNGFMPWSRIAGLSWKEEPITLVLVSRARNVAKRLEVPGGLYGEARKVLREQLRSRDIAVEAPGLHLGTRDQRDTI